MTAKSDSLLSKQLLLMISAFNRGWLVKEAYASNTYLPSIKTEMNKSVSAYLEQIVYALVHWLGVLQHVKLVYFSVLIEALSQERSQHLEMANQCDSLVCFAILLENLLHLPSSLPEFLWRLINHLILDELQELLLLLLIRGILVVLQMDVTGIPDMLAQNLNEPQLRMISHMTEVELREVLLLFLDMTADITGEAEDLGEDGMHFHANVASPEDFLAGLESPPVRTNKNNIDILSLKFLASTGALSLTLLGDAAVDILLGIGDFAIEVRNLNAVLPAQIWVQDLLKAQETFVEVGLGMPNGNQVAVFFFSVYLFNHIFYC